MLINETGTVTLENMVLSPKMHSKDFIPQYTNDFLGFLSDLGNGMLRSRNPVSDGQGHEFRVILDFMSDRLVGVILYPILNEPDGETPITAKEAEARRRDVCEGILQSLFGEPSGRTETDITYQFDDCSVVLWSSIGTKDMASGGCIIVDYGCRPKLPNPKPQ